MISRNFILVLVGAGAVSGVWLHGDSHGRRTTAAASLEAQAVAVEAARQEERIQQQEVNRALQQQYDDLAGINAGLLDDLERLRQRPDRPSLPRDPGADCAGASGAELSGADAEFLVREAARADRLRVALQACYAYADTVTSAGKRNETLLE